MDPLILIVNELQHASDEIERYERELTLYEAQSFSFANDMRYQRLVAEKMEVIRSVARMRTDLTERGIYVTMKENSNPPPHPTSHTINPTAVTSISAQGMAIYAMMRDNGVSYFLDKANLEAAPTEPAAEEIDIDEEPDEMRSPYPAQAPPVPVARVVLPFHTPQEHTSTCALTHTLTSGSEKVAIVPVAPVPASPSGLPPAPHTSLPAPPSSPPPVMPPSYLTYASPITPGHGPEHLIDLSKYTTAKAQLANIMRDHSAQKIHFVGLDDHVIAVPEYQQIRKYMKAGQDPALHMKGEYRSYFVGYVKRTNEFTQNKLFFPEFHPY